MKVSGIPVEVVRKPIKNLHVSVHPPDGRVRVSAPSLLDDDAVRLAVISKLSWIRRHQRAFAEQPRQSQREMVSGESHYFMGRRYRLNVLEHAGPNRVSINGNSELRMQVRPGSGPGQTRERAERMVSSATEGAHTGSHRQVAARAGRGGRRLGRQEDEDQVGQLQHPRSSRLAQPRACQETAPLLGIRTGP